MIIWINGAYGVGKSTIVSKVMEYFSDNEAVLLEADEYSERNFKQLLDEAKIESIFFPQIGGLPQHDMKFINGFNKIIEEKAQIKSKKIMIDMALVSNECKDGLFEPLADTYKDILHIIIVATEETIKLRIKNDIDRPDKMTAIECLSQNISFLQDNFPDAVRIKTDNKCIDEIAEEVYQVIMNWENRMIKSEETTMLT